MRTKSHGAGRAVGGSVPVPAPASSVPEVAAMPGAGVMRGGEALVSYAGRFFMVPEDEASSAADNAEAFSYVSAALAGSDTSAAAACEYLAEMGVHIDPIPLSRVLEMASDPAVAWVGRFERDPVPTVLSDTEDSGTPIPRRLVFLLFVMLFIPAVAMSPLAGGNRVSTEYGGESYLVAVFVGSLIFSTIILVSRSMTNLIAWRKAMPSAHARDAFRAHTAKWMLETVVVVVAFAVMSALFLAGLFY